MIRTLVYDSLRLGQTWGKSDSFKLTGGSLEQPDDWAEGMDRCRNGSCHGLLWVLAEGSSGASIFGLVPMSDFRPEIGFNKD
uniref:Uncharacterized protein n=1 Tax=Moniliophthora roreri TaxID=221103 RepID=A0A0W0FYX6_MONRR